MRLIPLAPLDAFAVGRCLKRVPFLLHPKEALLERSIKASPLLRNRLLKCDPFTGNKGTCDVPPILSST